MRRTTAAAILLLAPLLAFGVAACTAFRQQHAASTRPAEPSAPAATTPAGADFQALDDAARAARLRGEVAQAKEDLARAGKYRCCIRPSCDLCALHDGKCTCRDVIEMMGPGCGECLAGWLAGRGAVEGVDIQQVLRDRLAAPPPASPPEQR